VKSLEEVVHASEDGDKLVPARMNGMSRLKNLGVTMVQRTEIKKDPHREEDTDANKDDFRRR
jgi:hypothetical protein